MEVALHPVDLQPAVIYIKLGALNHRPATGYGVVQARARCRRRGPLKSRLVNINFIEVLVYSTPLRGSARNIYEYLKKSKREKACMGPHYFLQLGPDLSDKMNMVLTGNLLGKGKRWISTTGTISNGWHDLSISIVPHIAESGNTLVG